MGKITRIFEFDAAHRILNEKVKCFNLHGHRFKVEVTFEYSDGGSLGYAIDFKEIKRVAGDWIDKNLDHAAILNPLDKDLIVFCKKNGLRCHVMGLGNEGDINPSAENISAELFSIIEELLAKHPVTIKNVRLYETPNCWVDVTEGAVMNARMIGYYRGLASEYGVENYDSRLEDAKTKEEA